MQLDGRGEFGSVSQNLSYVPNGWPQRPSTRMQPASRGAHATISRHASTNELIGSWSITEREAASISVGMPLWYGARGWIATAVHLLVLMHKRCDHTGSLVVAIIPDPASVAHMPVDYFLFLRSVLIAREQVCLLSKYFLLESCLLFLIRCSRRRRRRFSACRTPPMWLLSSM